MTGTPMTMESPKQQKNTPQKKPGSFAGASRATRSPARELSPIPPIPEAHDSCPGTNGPMVQWLASN